MNWGILKYRIALTVVIFYILVGFFAPLIATSYPMTLRSDEGTYYPAFRHFLQERNIMTWEGQHDPLFLEQLEYSNKRSIVPFDPQYIDISNLGAQKPGSVERGTGFKHVLGTDIQGRDVLSGMIHGAYTSLRISLMAAAISLFIGLILAIPATYYGNYFFSTNTWGLLIGFILLSGLYSVIFIFDPFVYFGLSKITQFLSFLVLVVLVFWGFSQWTFVQKGRKIFLPIDAIMMRMLEFFKSIPLLLILLVLIALLPQQTTTSLSIIIGLLIWPTFYRYIRASIFEQKEHEFHSALVNLGYSDTRIVLVHFLPRIMRVLLVPLIATIVSIILFEATLSFLGIGLPDGIISWGKIIAEGRIHFNAWWLAVFPGLAIFFLVISLQLIGDHIFQKLDRK